jgi:hypothetical protein
MLAAATAAFALVAFVILVAGLRKYLNDDAYFVTSATKICQLTGIEDRERPGQQTGQLLSGVGAGVTGSDLGYPFEHGDRLYFLFGDTREIDADLCEPALCGTNPEPKVRLPGLDPRRFFRRLEHQNAGSRRCRQHRECCDPNGSAALSATEI